MNADCARCKQRPRLDARMGCLCGNCEDAVEGMPQAQLDADYESHRTSRVDHLATLTKGAGHDQAGA